MLLEEKYKAYFAEGRAEGRELGLEEGREEGRAEGRAEGRMQEALAIAKKLKAMGMSAKEITEATGLLEEDLKQIEL